MAGLLILRDMIDSSFESAFAIRNNFSLRFEICRGKFLLFFHIREIFKTFSDSGWITSHIHESPGDRFASSTRTASSEYPRKDSLSEKLMIGGNGGQRSCEKLSLQDHIRYPGHPPRIGLREVCYKLFLLRLCYRTPILAPLAIPSFPLLVRISPSYIRTHYLLYDEATL
eukprot:746025-Hanusia_phi.AAC.1